MRSSKYIFLLGLISFLLLGNAVNGQSRSKSDTLKNVPIIHLGIGGFLPGGDLARRFGANLEISTGFWWKTRSNWMFGVDGSFIIAGDNIREDSTILDGLLNSENQVIGSDGQYVLYQTYQRGYKCPVFKVGRMFPYGPKKANANSGFYALFGVGFMQHKIKINDQSRTFVQIDEGYYKGYDRLSNGLMLSQNFGYLYLGKGKRANFTLNFEFVQAFTRNRRSYNFDTRMADTESRLDLQYGLKLAWAIPLYKKMAEGYYFR